MSARLLDRFSDHARTRPDAPAYVDDRGRIVTYDGLAATASAMAEALAPRVRPGETVLLALPSGPDFAAAFLGGLMTGARMFPVSPDLTRPELVAAATKSAAVAAVGTEAVLAALRSAVRHLITPAAGGRGQAAPQRDRSRGGLLLQSSGTTGRPKIVFRSAESLDAVADATCDAIGFGPDDRVLVSLPMCHSYGIEHGLLAPLFAGSCVHGRRGFDLQAVLGLLTGGGVTLFPGVPFMFESLARAERSADAGAGPAFAGLRRAYSAGGPLPAAVYEAFKVRYGVRVSQLYGATEVGSVTFGDPARAGGLDPASVGTPMRGVSVRVLDPRDPGGCRPLPPGVEGHVAVAAPSMLCGYVPDEPVPLADGHFLTGDLGKVDGWGRLTVTGRIKLLIDVGGLKVNPVEVEDVLAQHPAVGSCVVVPVKVSETVCRLKAIVTPRQGEDAPPEIEPDALRRFARDRLVSYKIPRLFEVRQTLPRSATGKILRHLVAA